ncbi:MAG: prephenate dehydrogenase [Coriobacteriia bacterium]|nr:prephenate dehydrogenase [Coriobacteriia bacterium]
MVIGVVGMGLIGGSFAKAAHNLGNDTILGFDIDESVVYKAILVEAIDAKLNEDRIKECDMILLALYPKAAVEWTRRNADRIKKNAILADLCGIKAAIFDDLSSIAGEHWFTYIGAHPMAGLETSGFNSASETLFKEASLVLTPMKSARIEEIEVFKKFCERIGFTNFEIASADYHDEMIAFTSQLAHVISSAYIKSPTARKHAGFSAGSYLDMTRVAKLNEVMWTELFLENSTNLVTELEGITLRLEEYTTAIKIGDATRLEELLRAGREQKEEIDNRIVSKEK